MKKLFLLFLLPLAAVTANAQTVKDNGSIKYKIELSGVDDPQAVEMFKDAGMEIGFMNDRHRMDMSMPMMRTRAFSKGDSSLVLLEMMGNKMMMMVPNDEVNSRKLNEKEYEVTETKDSKTIAGYKARKYNVKTKSGETFAVYATDALPMKLANYSPYSKIKGTPLEYEMSQGPYKMKVTAQAVNMGSETEASYQYDETGYTRMTIDQMKQMFGGGQKQDHGHDHSDPNHKH